MFQSTSTLRALQSASKCSFFISKKLGLLAPGGFSTMATCDISSSSDVNVFLRSYQVVVAATLDMGIGKDGKLPWKLPSDLNFFKELTSTTLDPAKRNVVVMGRRTWDSIPLKFRPLPGRLNVVLTCSQKLDFDGENVVVCGSIPSALQLLAENPYFSSTEKVFVIGGGQVLREALNAPECDAIHITEIETRIECDTFIPTIDLSSFRLWYSSPPMVENNIRFSFATYVRLRNSANGKLNDDLSSNKIEVKNYRFLPKMIFEKRDEYGYLRPVEEIISSGVEKNDITGTCWLSKFWLSDSADQSPANGY